MDRGGARAFPLPRPPGVDAGFDDDGPPSLLLCTVSSEEFLNVGLLKEKN